METMVIRDIINEHRQCRRDEAFYGVSYGYRTKPCANVTAYKLIALRSKLLAIQRAD